MADKQTSSFLRFAAIFALVYLGTQLATNYFFPDKPDVSTNGRILLSVSDNNVSQGNAPIVTIENQTASGFALAQRCPLPPFEVYRSPETEPLTATGTSLPCEYQTSVEPGSKLKIDLAPWKYALFNQVGTYELRLATTTQAPTQPDQDDQGVSTVTFQIGDVGFITKLFRTFVTKPLLNLLVFIASLLPDHNLGWSIIILTVLVKLLLFIPTQHALEGQKKLQELQPKLEELKKKHKNDPQALNKETLALWKKEKVNPFQSCLPMLLQFPVLIGLFYVIRDGSHLALSRHLIYPMYDHLTWTFNPLFLGLNLLLPSSILFPPLLAATQFIQLKLSFLIARKKKGGKEEIIDVTEEKPKSEVDQAQQMQQRMMLYGLPIMIAVFAFQFPAAVSLYWLVSTLFAIGQQVIVNRKHF
ncbi:MAG TPA: YidC/Oxa1 family membrane protein insertase [Candidatus Peribacteraceae bacterium]|nr:YidC/Oxa1 family membrane protein insertase [Candidatus Peribacteraceae bacterium]